MKYLLNIALVVLLGSLLLLGCSSSGDESSGILSPDDGENSNISGSDENGLATMQMGAIIDKTFVDGQLALSLPDGETLATGGSVTVNVIIRDCNGDPYTEEVDINFTTKFVRSEEAIIDNVVTTDTGSATVIYQATGGHGVDTITATADIGQKTLSATAMISVAGPIAGSIDFISATPETIAFKGTGGPARSETSVLVFMVVDEYGDPVEGETVEFKLSTDVGGLALSNSSAVSDSEGLVQTTVNAGNVPTHIRVHATIADSDPLITVVSDELLVSTGLPDQNSISLSAETLNPEAWHYNNVEVPIIFQAADHFNNFVPDGTIVYFTTEGGSIDDSCTIIDGVCEVTWRSGDPRPDDGGVTILAFCIGEESFVDRNGNGFFDEEDLFDLATDMGEVFRDDNDSGDYDYGEPFWDFDNNREFTSSGNGIYNGTLCSDAAKASGLCTRELVYVQKSMRLIMSGSFAVNISFSPGSVDLRGGSSHTVFISISELNNNPMPMGTEIEFTTTNGNIVGNSSFTVPNTNQLDQPLVYQVLLEPSEDDRTSGQLQVTVTTPFGNVTTESIGVIDDN
ncbi:MAG: Ig-like domain-containing protein [Desulfobacterales bacterium]|nr:Ig-like domain-containing protein [Desulfobacterales bacterium]